MMSPRQLPKVPDWREDLGADRPASCSNIGFGVDSCTRNADTLLVVIFRLICRTVCSVTRSFVETSCFKLSSRPVFHASLAHDIGAF